MNKQIQVIKAKGTSTAEILRVVPAHAALEHAALRTLSRLTAPPELAISWHQMLVYRKALATELGELVAAARSNNTVAKKNLQLAKATLHKKLLSLGTHAGFKSCAQVG